jgi:hypothetical protein
VSYTVRRRERIQASPKYGLRQRWIEWQVVAGRKVVARFDLERQARAWIAEQGQEGEARLQARIAADLAAKAVPQK